MNFLMYGESEPYAVDAVCVDVQFTVVPLLFGKLRTNVTAFRLSVSANESKNGCSASNAPFCDASHDEFRGAKKLPRFPPSPAWRMFWMSKMTSVFCSC